MANTEKTYKNTRTGDVYTTADPAAQERLDGLPEVWQVVGEAVAAKEPKAPRPPRAPRTPKPGPEVVPTTTDVVPAVDDADKGSADDKGTDGKTGVVPPAGNADGKGIDGQDAE